MKRGRARERLRDRFARLCLIAFVSFTPSGCGQKDEAVAAGEIAGGRPAAFLRAPEEVRVESADADAPDALSLVSSYNARDCGGPGWRSVTLELLNGSEVTRTFTVANLWECDGARGRTLFHLEAPAGLKGISYLLSEGDAETEGVRVHLFLPAGERRVLEVSASDFEDGLLGSDFAYSDVRLRLPAAGYEFSLAGQGSLSGQSVWVVEARPSAPATRRGVPWHRARFYLARDFDFLLGADYSDADARVYKRMRVETFRREGGAWTATRMVMYGAGGNASVLTLNAARFGLPKFAPHVLTPEALPSAGENIKAIVGGR